MYTLHIYNVDGPLKTSLPGTNFEVIDSRVEYTKTLKKYFNYYNKISHFSQRENYFAINIPDERRISVSRIVNTILVFINECVYDNLMYF